MGIIILIFLSNTLFFMLFNGDNQGEENIVVIPTIPHGHGLLRIEAQLKTRFEINKPISLFDAKNNQFYNRAILWEELKHENFEDNINANRKSNYIILVPDNDVIKIINFKNIIIYPFLKNNPHLPKASNQGASYEIHY